MKSIEKTIKTMSRTTTVVGILLVFFVPFWWMILTALKSKADTLQFPPAFWVNAPHWENFSVAFNAFPFLKYLGNSLIITGAILVFQIFTVIPAAYAFARYTFRGKRLLFSLTLASVMIPAQLIFLPVFILITHSSVI